MESWFDDAIVEKKILVQKNSICDDETSDKHINNRQFNPDLCVLSILEGFGHEIGIIAEASVRVGVWMIIRCLMSWKKIINDVSRCGKSINL